MTMFFSSRTDENITSAKMAINDLIKLTEAIEGCQFNCGTVSIAPSDIDSVYEIFFKLQKRILADYDQNDQYEIFFELERSMVKIAQFQAATYKSIASINHRALLENKDDLNRCFEKLATLMISTITSHLIRLYDLMKSNLTWEIIFNSREYVAKQDKRNAAKKQKSAEEEAVKTAEEKGETK